ncbi:MAG: ribosome biogenesis GTPase Der [Gemmataceae bacterium]|nr:ribosome biogenesis GTPase Der [Gemmataceae bacterium]
MAVPRVAIVGRPNVGKSSLFNWLAGRRISIVDPTAGVTRDRVSTLVEHNDRWFEMTDTGGIGIVDSDELTEDVERQIKLALEQADVILFVVDARDGVVALDEEVNRRLRSVNAPVIAVANKCDDKSYDDHAADFYRLGRGKFLPVSAEQKRGRDEVLAAILKHLPVEAKKRPTDPQLKLAIVGRRNTGKSTFINSLADAERVIVSEVAGTTRDAVDVRIERDGKTIIAIDTAGVRKKKSLSSNIEFYSLHRAERSIRRADVVLMFFDPRVRVSQVDKKLVELIYNEHKPTIFVVNKWDLVKDAMPTEKIGNYLRSTFPMLEHVPIACITAKSGKNVEKLLNLAQHLHKQASKRVTTGELNRLVEEALAAQSPPLRQNRRAKIFYGSQVDTNPPTIVLFTNGPELFDPPYRKYLLNFFRDRLPFTDVPIRLVLRNRGNRNGDPTAPGTETDHEVSALHDTSVRPPVPRKSNLKFKTKLEDGESQKFDTDLWRDL